MIIDSHAHYAHKLYTGEFSYLGTEDGGYCLRRGDRREMLETMESSGITPCIEPSTDLERIEDQLSLAAEYPHSIRLAMGLHPKKCGQTPWEDRAKQVLITICRPRSWTSPARCSGFNTRSGWPMSGSCR